MVTGLCRMHTQELDVGDPRLGPIVKFQNSPGHPVRPRALRNFFLVTDKDGDDQLCEVSEDFYPRVHVQGAGAAEVASETKEPV